MSAIETRPGRPRILLVDDAELNREIIGHVLMDAGFEVDLATDGESACAATWSRTYDLVLMDIEMPGMNGFEAAARIRAREGVMSGIKIAALSATRQPDAEAYSFWSGIDAFIAKPIEPGHLVTRVNELTADVEPGEGDWKPVWRLAKFAKVTERLDDEDVYLHELLGLLDAAEAAIEAKRSFSEDYYRTLQELLDLSTLLGFEEIAGLCELSKRERGLVDTRCRDPNLAGAIDRARYAMDVYRKEQHPTPVADWWARTRVNVQSLFRGGAPAWNAPTF